MMIKFAKERPIVCVQGLGFVGAAMSLAVASAVDKNGEPCFNVIGIDLPNSAGQEKVKALNNGRFPFETTDQNLIAAAKNVRLAKNFYATCDDKEFAKADIVVVDVNLDIYYDAQKQPYLNLSAFKKAMRTLGQRLKEDVLVMVETTVPPGTCEKVVKPVLEEEFRKRGLHTDKLKIAHSYERVMPGDYYFYSIINYWRVFSGVDDKSREACRAFLSKIINIADYPLTELKSTTASETAKVLENSYRATTIAFMEEWGRFAEAVGINMFDIVDAIRKRPTHSNMRQPGFGVGGYCLTKDPYFAKLAAKDLFHLDGFDFPFCSAAVRINNAMPLVSLEKIKSELGGNLHGKKILLLGISYKQDVGDTRYSPAEIFAKAAQEEGALMTYYDPMIRHWDEMQTDLPAELPDLRGYDAVVLTVCHGQFTTTDFVQKLAAAKTFIFDANHVLSAAQLAFLKNKNCHLGFIGRGDF